jgi:molecular chaperone GrpE
MNNEFKNQQNTDLEQEQDQSIDINQSNQLELQLGACQQDLQVSKDKYLLLRADFDNYKKRFERERLQLFEDTKIQILRKLLPVVDDIDRAVDDRMKHEVAPELSAWMDGFGMIQKSLHKILQEQGLQEIGMQVEFDPELYEAIVSVDTEGQQAGTVVAILQKGYKVGARVVRPAKVSIAR